MRSESWIHVVEDDQAMRESLVMLLEESGYKVRAYCAAEELLTRGMRLEPGCVVSDVRMPAMDGLALLRRLRSDGFALPLILITGHGDIAMAVNAMKAGAMDFIEKPFAAETLIDSIETALRSRTADAESKSVEAARERLAPLTSREHEVLDQLVAGKSNKEVAAKLGISPRTVEFHRAHIIDKTGAKGLPELVRLWLATRAHQN
jgi:two-component system response regulator FixJ